MPLPFPVNGHEVIKLLDFVATISWYYISSQIKEQSYQCQWLCHHKSTLVGRNCLFIFSENIDYYQTSDYVCSSMEMHPSQYDQQTGRHHLHIMYFLIIWSSSLDTLEIWGRSSVWLVHYPLHNGSFIFLREFLKKLCYALTTNLTGLIETKSSGSDYISLYHVQSTLISKSKFHRLVSETD